MTRAQGVDAIAVVVPARDEADRLPGCLAAVCRSAEHPALTGVATLIVVALDTCSDRSAVVAANALTGRMHALVDVAAGNVGRARAAGTAVALDWHADAGGEPERLWLAWTDADTAVPQGWLADQLVAAAGGVDAVLGTVAVTDWQEHPTHVRERYEAAYRQRIGSDGHAHVHGANLGVRGSAYLAVGGVAPLASSEDVALVAALVAAGRPVLRDPGLTVRTSARRRSRVVSGFGDYLLSLDEMHTRAPRALADGGERQRA